MYPGKALVTSATHVIPAGGSETRPYIRMAGRVWRVSARPLACTSAPLPEHWWRHVRTLGERRTHTCKGGTIRRADEADAKKLKNR